MRIASTSSLLRLAVAAGLVLADPVMAQPGADLVKSKGCVNCHASETTRVGPSVRDIAARHRGDAAAAEKIVAALKQGRGHPKIAASDAELVAMVTFMLAGR
jgi:cytochrome c